jgi:hypothetical protein
MKMRRVATVRLFVVVFLLSSILIGLEASRMAWSQTGTGAKTPAQLWLSWSSEARADYVWGYLSGFEEGKRAGCSFYEKQMTASVQTPALPEKLPRRVCIESLPVFGEQYYQTYADAITNYYTNYPNDREAGVPRILSELASPPGLNIDQIHEKLSRRAVQP